MFEENKDTWEGQESYTKLRDIANTRIEEMEGGGEEYYDEENGDGDGDDNKEGENGEGGDDDY